MVPLSVRSSYSLMWGTEAVPRICRAARRMGYERLALTDTDNLYGLWPFLEACRREGLTPIVGAEVTAPHTARRAVCLVEDDRGYTNLCRLLSRRHSDGDFDLRQAVAEHRAGLVVLTRDAELLRAWHAAGVAVVAALPRRPLPAAHPLRREARRCAVPLAATPGSFFLRPGDHGLHRLVRAIDANTSLSRLKAPQVAPVDAWLASPAEYRRRFATCPEAIRTTRVVAERLTFTGPRFGVVLPPWRDSQGRPALHCLRDAAYRGARKRYGDELPEPVVERLEHELRIIAAMGFGAYFLVVREIVALSPRICGRGSAAASLVAYCLGITNVCPLRHNLYFERFLNPGRKDPPDIDVDFAWDERDEVLAAVLSRHRGHAAMVANHVGFRPRMAVRETAKVFGLPEVEIGRVTRRLPRFWRLDPAEGDLLAALKACPELKRQEFPPPWPQILQLAQRIVGAPRYLSVHSGGMVITPKPIDHYVPVERASKGVPVIQWEKEGAEDAGLVKIDLLGNRSLGVIRDAVANVHANGQPFEEDRWLPEHDGDTQEAIRQGRTMGCFYIESPAMRLLQQKTGVGDFEHLVIHSSIIRPAANEFIREYIRRLHGGAWEPIHPRVADVLTETFGIMVYQEDVSRVASALAGFSAAEADGLRKVLSKKDREHHLRDFHRRFVAGARGRGVGEAQIAAVWEMILSFSGYSFCKPHSASYARVSFQAAYLKVHHPAEFMAAVISNQGGFYSTFAYVSEARRMGLAILPPDVHRSEIRWTGCGNALRVGLLSVRDLGQNSRQRIVAERRRRPYKDLRDFLERVRPDDDEARALVHAGALDRFSTDGHRGALLWEVARRQNARLHGARSRPLFAASAGELPRPVFPPQDPHRRLGREFSALGFLCGGHPMTLDAEQRRRADAVKAVDLGRHVGRTVCLAGWLVTGKRVHTRQGEPMEFLTFEDETGLCEATFFPEIYRRFCHLLERGRPYLLTGRVEQDWGAVTLTVRSLHAMRSSILQTRD